MKKIAALILALVLCLTLVPAVAEGNVTVQEWLDAGGQCGDCTVTVTVLTVLNPVLAIVGDDTAQVNLFGVHLYDSMYGFGMNGFCEGDTLVLSNPVYNVFDGNVEMADAQLADIIVQEEGFTRAGVQQWLDASGEMGNCFMIVKVMEIINPVLAAVADESGTVNLFGFLVNGEFADFMTQEIKSGDLLVLVNPRYNEFEGNVEMADSILFRLISSFVEDGNE